MKSGCENKGKFLFIISFFVWLLFALQAPAGAQEKGAADGTPVKSPRERQAEMTEKRIEMIKQQRAAAAGKAAEATEPQAAQGESQPTVVKEGLQKGDLITMNFKDVDLHMLVKFMSDLTGKNFVIDPNLRANMTILSPEKISPEEAYQVFLSVLDVHGFAAVPSGKVVKIIQAMDAKSKGLETHMRDDMKYTEDKIITQLLPLKYGEAADFAKFLAPLVPKTGLLVPYPDSNTLIIIDTESNIKRIVRIAGELDVPDTKGRIHILELDNANAKKLATKLTQLFQTRKGPTPGGDTVKIIPDERTNSLIIMASPSQVSDIREMLDQLDKKVGKRQGNIRIVALQHAVAEDLVKVLTEIPTKGSSSGAVEDKEGKAKAPVISKDVQIFADKATNSLVILAEPDEYEVIEEIIQQLDTPRTMVYVEALIVEVSATKSLDLGVEWRAGYSYNQGYSTGTPGGAVLGGSPGAPDVDALGTGLVPSGFFVGGLGNAITLGDLVFPTFGAFIRAVRADHDFNIISTPQILTMDNAEATIEVGQNIPFVTRVDQPTQVTERAIQTFEYKDVGVTLKVTPHINDNRQVKLKVEQSVKSVVDSTALGGTVLAPTTTYRKTKTEITVNDGETAVLGGLIEKRLDLGKTQTPCLGGIPVFGWLFKSVSDRDEKTNLLVFLSPHIVENPEEARKLYEQKRGDIDRTVDEASKRQQSEKVRRKALE